jgi:hypothetical protein
MIVEKSFSEMIIIRLYMDFFTYNVLIVITICIS